MGSTGWRSFKHGYQDLLDIVPIEKRDVSEFSLSGRSPKKANRVIDMAGMKPFEADSQSCVVAEDNLKEEG